MTGILSAKLQILQLLYKKTLWFHKKALSGLHLWKGTIQLYILSERFPFSPIAYIPVSHLHEVADTGETAAPNQADSYNKETIP